MSSTAVISSGGRLAEEDRGLAPEAEIDSFLREVEKRAYRIAAVSIGDRDEAFDLVQDAMIKLAEKYGDKPGAELPLLFQRILQNTIHDWFRRTKVRNTCCVHGLCASCAAWQAMATLLSGERTCEFRKRLARAGCGGAKT